MHDHLPRSLELHSAATSRLLLVDLQERLVPIVSRSKRVVSNCKFLCRAAQLLDVPQYCSEQYPQGLGATIPDLFPHEVNRVSKTRFSAAQAMGWPTAAESSDGRFRVVIAGIETHICVLQTAFDLLAAGYRVSVVTDAVSSRRRSDHRAAIQRMISAGIEAISAEGLVFEWCESSEHPNFKAISQLVKERSSPRKPVRRELPRKPPVAE